MEEKELLGVSIKHLAQQILWLMNYPQGTNRRITALRGPFPLRADVGKKYGFNDLSGCWFEVIEIGTI